MAEKVGVVPMSVGGESPRATIGGQDGRLIDSPGPHYQRLSAPASRARLMDWPKPTEAMMKRHGDPDIDRREFVVLKVSLPMTLTSILRTLIPPLECVSDGERGFPNIEKVRKL